MRSNISRAFFGSKMCAVILPAVSVAYFAISSFVIILFSIHRFKVTASPFAHNHFVGLKRATDKRRLSFKAQILELHIERALSALAAGVPRFGCQWFSRFQLPSHLSALSICLTPRIVSPSYSIAVAPCFGL